MPGGADGAPVAGEAFRVPASARFMSLFATAVIGLVTLPAAGIAAYALAFGSWGLAAGAVAMAALMAELFRYVLTDLLGKWGLRVGFEPDGLALALPSGRSLIHRPPAFAGKLPWADIAAVETRLEAYRSARMTMMQRPYALLFTDGRRLFLFEDRALATGIGTAWFGGLAERIAARVGVPLQDLGMVEGRGGLLGVRFAAPPGWPAPPLPASRAERLWQAAGRTGIVVTLLVAAALAIRVLAG